MPSENTFRTLIDRVRAGDNEAVAELVRRYEPAIRRIVRVRLFDSRLRRVLESSDVCQMVLTSFVLRAARGQFAVETPEDLVRLLGQMARNKVTDQARREGAGRRGGDRKPVGTLVDPQAPGGTPSEEVALAELLQRFREELTAEERQIQDFRDQGLQWDEIAARLGGSGEALRKKQERAFQRIVKQLGLEKNDED
jgi:RNA polymerase sigma-70 factor (ECF subfamily)